MIVLLILIPVSLGLVLMGLLCFAWSVRTNQYEDPEGEAQRILDKLYDNHPAGKNLDK